MKDLFQPGDQKLYTHRVEEAEAAAFHGELVHRVCSTFALARAIEWSSRLFVLEMKEDHEEGVGTRLSIDHHGPAFVGEELEILATIKSLVKNELICTYEVKVKERLVASGETGQKILDRERLAKLFDPNGR